MISPPLLLQAMPRSRYVECDRVTVKGENGMKKEFDLKYVLLPLLAISLVGFVTALVWGEWRLAGAFAVLLVGVGALCLTTSGALDNPR